jgi:hypothetical protein
MSRLFPVAATLAVVAAGFGAGCMAPARLNLANAAPISQPPPASAPGTTIVACAPIEDKRLDPEVLGLVGGRPFSASEVSSWVLRSLTGLTSRSFSVRPAAGVENAPVTLRPRLLKVYVDSIRGTKTAVVVLEVAFVEASGREATLIYRGQHAGINWGSDEAEVTSALQKALGKCADQLRVDLDAQLARIAPRT